MSEKQQPLRVALLAGTLGQGGAEKQLVYMARALHEAGVNVRVYSLMRGEYHEQALRALGVKVVWVGRCGNPLLRLPAITAAMRRFKPHVIQSTHFYTNIYAAAASRLLGAAGIGSLRSDLHYELKTNGRWGPLQLRLPRSILANSYAAKQNAERWGISKERIYVLPNVIDLCEFDRKAHTAPSRPEEEGQPPTVTVINVGNLVDYKRQDRFLAALDTARREVPGLRGLIVGEGPERAAIEKQAAELGLLPGALELAGRSAEVPAMLARSQIFLLTSENEGFPNVLIEAMAASLPVVTTPAGDAASIVQDEVTGYVVPFDDIEGMAERVVGLARSPELRRTLGEAGRKRVEQEYAYSGLSDRLLSLYREVAHRQGNRRLLPVLGIGY